MSEAKKTPDEKATRYATKEDFHRIFDQDTNNLHLLAFLLSADHDKAEQCFVAGLEDSVKGNAVFKEWASSWARRTIIQNAIHLVAPRQYEENEDWRAKSLQLNRKVPAEVAEDANRVRILGLSPFERFVYVMSVVERYSDHRCSVLLGCVRRDVIAARNRALQQIGSARNFTLSGR